MDFGSVSLKRNSDNRAAKLALMKENPSVEDIGQISRYIRKLDQRLSVPRNIKESPSSPLKSNHISNFSSLRELN